MAELDQAISASEFLDDAKSSEEGGSTPRREKTEAELTLSRSFKAAFSESVNAAIPSLSRHNSKSSKNGR
jgi:hypothetical protein